MNQDISEIFDVCLQMMQDGKSLEKCLLQYPEYAGELKPLLETSVDIKKVPLPQPKVDELSPLLIKAGRGNCNPQQKNLKTTKKKLLIFRPRVIQSIAAIIIIGVFLLPADAISSRSLPGDFLYPIKLITEKVQFILTFGNDDKAELRMVFSQKRLSELSSTLKKDGRFDKDLMGKMLQEANRAFEEISAGPPNSSNLLLAKFYHLNAYHKEALENIKLHLSEHEKEIVNNGISRCNNFQDRCSRWMGNRQKIKSGGQGKSNLRSNKKSSWQDNCNW